MVARLSKGRKISADGIEAADAVIISSEPGADRALVLAEKDAEAFDAVMRAYRLPKGDEAEVSVRKGEIRNATWGAAAVPLETAFEACELLVSIQKLAEHGNSNALTDLAASAELANTAAHIAAMNVRINLVSIEGEDVEKEAARIEGLLATSNELVGIIRSIVSERLGW
tara:strand:+ start:1090 stop:1599 length:510 start_codon:yes stop_codon:yes gene_type:complete